MRKAVAVLDRSDGPSVNHGKIISAAELVHRPEPASPLRTGRSSRRPSRENAVSLTRMVSHGAESRGRSSCSIVIGLACKFSGLRVIIVSVDSTGRLW
jgi:hypothetical protein